MTFFILIFLSLASCKIFSLAFMAFPGLKRNPLMPSFTNSGIAMELVAITGSPDAIASIMNKPCGSTSLAVKKISLIKYKFFKSALAVNRH